MKPLLALVLPPQVSSLDLQRYLIVVVVVVAFVVMDMVVVVVIFADVDAPTIFLEDTTHVSSASSSINILELLLSPRMPDVLLLLLLSPSTLSEDDWKSINIVPPLQL